MKDPRYAIRQEFTGAPNGPQYVLRFCGDWLGAYRRKRDALSHAIKHNRNRLTFG